MDESQNDEEPKLELRDQSSDFKPQQKGYIVYQSAIHYKPVAPSLGYNIYAGSAYYDQPINGYERQEKSNSNRQRVSKMVQKPTIPNQATRNENYGTIQRNSKSIPYANAANTRYEGKTKSKDYQIDQAHSRQLEDQTQQSKENYQAFRPSPLIRSGFRPLILNQGIQQHRVYNDEQNDKVMSSDSRGFNVYKNQPVQSQYRQPHQPLQQDLATYQINRQQSSHQFRNPFYPEKNCDRAHSKPIYSRPVATNYNEQHRRNKRQANNDEGTSLCETKKMYIQPKAALNDRSEWKFIINLGDVDSKFKQIIKVDVCS